MVEVVENLMQVVDQQKRDGQELLLVDGILLLQMHQELMRKQEVDLVVVQVAPTIVPLL